MAGRGFAVGRVVAGALLTLAVLIAAVLVWLILPQAPRSTGRMAFLGFIGLPRDAPLAVMDYVTIDGRRLFVTGTSSGKIDKVDLGTSSLPGLGAVSQMAGQPRPHGVAIVDDLGLGFVTRSEVNRVDVFDPKTLQPLGAIPVAEDADAILYDPQARLIYVANGDAKLATLIDPARRAVIKTIPLGGAPEFPALDPATGLIYQNLNDMDQVAAVDIKAGAVVGRWSLAPCRAPSGLAIDPERRRLFAVCAKNSMLVVFDLAQHRVLDRLKVVSRPDTVAFDPSNHRVYVAGVGGELTVIQQGDGGGYQVTDNIATHLGAHTLGLDTSTHRVYVAYASLLLPPRLAVFAPR